MEPKIAILLVAYNAHHDTVECIESLKKITYKNVEIILVDNASPEKPTAEQDAYFRENTTYIQSKVNTGFAGGNNLAANVAREKFKPEYLLLLNNDTVVNPNFLEPLVEVFQKNEKVGVATGKICYYSEMDKIWFAGGVYDSKHGKVSHLKCNQADDRLKEEKTVSFVTGCLMLIPSDIWFKTGGLDEDFFMYAEDLEICCKINQMGYKLCYTSESIIYHKVGTSVGRNSPMQQYYNLRNNLQVVKQYGKGLKGAYLCKLKTCARDIVRGRASAKAAYYAWRDFLKNKYRLPQEILPLIGEW